MQPKMVEKAGTEGNMTGTRKACDFSPQKPEPGMVCGEYMSKLGKKARNRKKKLSQSREHFFLSRLVFRLCPQTSCFFFALKHRAHPRIMFLPTTTQLFLPIFSHTFFFSPFKILLLLIVLFLFLAVVYLCYLSFLCCSVKQMHPQGR
jgi:hypothetical protein